MLILSQAWEPPAWSLCSLLFPGLLFHVGTCCLCAALPLGPPCTPAWAGWSQQGIRSCWLEGGITFRVKQEPWDNHKLLGNCSHFCWGQGSSQLGRVTPMWLDPLFSFPPEPTPQHTHIKESNLRCCLGLGFAHALKQLGVWKLPRMG